MLVRCKSVSVSVSHDKLTESDIGKTVQTSQTDHSGQAVHSFVSSSEWLKEKHLLSEQVSLVLFVTPICFFFMLGISSHNGTSQSRHLYRFVGGMFFRINVRKEPNGADF